MSQATSVKDSAVQSAGTSAAKKRPTAAARSGLKVDDAETKRRATAILEVLAGVRTPRDAAGTLGVSLPRYYQWEHRALAGLLAACAAPTLGPRPSLERENRRLKRELAASQRECTRYQSLVRAAQRAVGIATPQPPKPVPKGTKPPRRHRPTARALRAARVLERNSPRTTPSELLQITADPPVAGNGLVVPEHAVPREIVPGP